MRNRLPPGRLVTIAPKYASASRALKRAQTESEKLVADFAAQRTDGTRAAVLKLLETATPAEPVGDPALRRTRPVRAGCGDRFEHQARGRRARRLGDRAAGSPSRSRLPHAGLLQRLRSRRGGRGVRRGRRLGRRVPRPAVRRLHRAALVGRRRGCRRRRDRAARAHRKPREPIGAALREIRAAHGATSPTFYSYLYYGDVTARFAAR